MAGGHGFSLAFPVARPPRGAAQSLLRGGQLVRGGASPARIIDMLAVAGGGETDDPDVDASFVAGRGQRIRCDVLATQHQHPAPSPAFDLHCRDMPPNRSV
jgi:hypothetical protein